MGATPADGDETAVEWRRVAVDAVTPPIVRRVPYLELKLEHPELEATGSNEQFYPDAVPYELDGTGRVFYWRSALSPGSAAPAEWEGACATTHELAGIDAVPSAGPALTTGGATGETVVVDGTVGGDATTAHLPSYAPPTVTIDDLSESAVELRGGGRTVVVSAGTRRRVALPERQVEPAGSETGATVVTPELVVRYPGRREIHHPAPGETYDLFPSFGLDVDEIPQPLAVPTTAGELDHVALADALGVDLSERPYPERVLWQAFSFTAFDPHGDGTPALAQLPTGHIALVRDTPGPTAPR